MTDDIQAPGRSPGADRNEIDDQQNLDRSLAISLCGSADRADAKPADWMSAGPGGATGPERATLCPDGLNRLQIAVDGFDDASGEIVLTLIVDPPRVCESVTVAGDQVQFCLEGEIGRTYVVEASPDLVNWTFLATSLNNDGVLRFSDPAKSNFPRRYYRVTYEP